MIGIWRSVSELACSYVVDVHDCILNHFITNYVLYGQ